VKRLAAIAVGLVALGAPAVATAKPCRRAPGQQTLVKSTRVRIFEVRTSSKTDPVKVFGCYAGTGRDFRIDRNRKDDSIGEVALSGAVVGFADSVALGSGNDERLISVDLGTGRRLRQAPAVVNQGAVSSLVSALVVKRSGSMAWIVTPNAFLLGYEVSKIEAAGRARLYAGDDISQKYLVLSGMTLGWRRNDGTILTATLR
jgi:hypothetical protein